MNSSKTNKIMVWMGIAVLIGSYLGLRLYKLEERTNFSMDQGISMLRAREIWQNKEITLIGPPASAVVNGRYFFYGPLDYYLIALIGWIGNWEPDTMAVIMVFLTLIGGWYLYRAIKLLSNKKAAVTGLIIFTFLPVLITYSNFIWNPNFLLLLTPIYLYWLVRAHKTDKVGWYLAAGVMGGAALQLHYQFILIIGATLTAGIIMKMKWSRMAVLAAGVIAGISPLIIFDIRNNWYNSRTIFWWLTAGGKQNLGWQWHYFLAYIVILIVPAAIGLNKLDKKIKAVILGGLIIISAATIELTPKNYWNLKVQKEVVGKILAKGCPSNYNIAQTINGDTRAYSLRYLLTVKNCPPMGVEAYPMVKTLFLIAPPERLPETETVWEVKSIGKFQIKDKELINKEIVYYELELVN